MIADRVHGDRGLAALALYEAVAECNRANIRAVVDAFEPAELVNGLVTLVDSLVLSVAVANGSDRGTVVETLRALLLTYGAAS